MTTRYFCAICADDIPDNAEPISRPLGRGGALVRVCADCDAEPIVARDREPMDYEPLSALGAGEKIAAFARDVLPKQGDKTAARPLSPGYVMIRIAVRAPDGTHRDNREAYESMRTQPWFASVRPLGSVVVSGVAWHLFERPAVTPRDLPDPLAAIEHYRTKR